MEQKIEYVDKMLPALQALLQQDPYKNIRYIVLRGGRGGSKSYQACLFLLIVAINFKIRVLFCREIQRALKESSYTMLKIIIERNGWQEFFDVKTDGIYGRNGSEFIFQGLYRNLESVKGITDLDFCFVDEAQAISDESIEILEPTVRGGFTHKNSIIIFSFNPRNADDPIYKMFGHDADLPPDTLLIDIGLDDNPFAAESLRNHSALMKKRDPERWDFVYGGKLKKRRGDLVFKNWKTGDLDDLVEELELNPLLGLDWGFGTDPCAFVECYIIKDAEVPILYIANEAYEYGIELRNIPSMLCGSDRKNPPRWKNLREFEGFESARRGTLIRADHKPELIKHLKDVYDFNITKADKGKDSIIQGIEFLHDFDIVIHHRCENMIFEAQNYKFERDKDSEDVTTKIIDKHNHLWDATRYAVESVRKNWKRGEAAGIWDDDIMPTHFEG